MSNTVKNRVIGVDVRVERTTIAVVDQRGNILATDTFLTKDYPDVNSFLTELSERIVMIAESNGGFENIRSVGISAPSSNYLTGCIENAPNIPWKGIIPLAAMLRDRIGLAVALGNNSHITALGEQVYGAAHGMQNFIVVTFGHGGLGSCIYSNGLPYLGTNGSAGELGHTCVEDNGRLCSCGRKGCLEAYATDRGIVQTAKELMAASTQPSMMRSLEEVTSIAIAQCCEQGDELSIEVYRITGEMLGIGLANYATVIDPEAIILTGGISHAGKWLLEPARASFEEHVFGNLKGKVKVLASRLDDRERDVLGASALAWSVPEYSLFK